MSTTVNTYIDEYCSSKPKNSIILKKYVGLNELNY